MKTYLKKTALGLGVLLEVFIAFLFFYGTIAMYGAIIPTGEVKSKCELYIYVQSNGIHTDVCLPTQTDDVNWLLFISPEHYSKNFSFEYVTIGWGDKGFFLDTPTWADLKVSTALNAAFLPSTTAMHVKYSKEPKVSTTRKKVFLDREDYLKMTKYIKRSFKTKDNAIELIGGKGYSNDDNFYEANKSYHMFRTCNRWTNRVLKEANIKTGVFALFPNGIISHL
ncbi:MAG: TIGR02117 family protein [Crocinitomicaceae bacterium]